MSNPPRASLLGLPAELRLRIYSFIWGPEIWLCKANYSCITAGPITDIGEISRSASTPLPLWLKTCKQILREGIEPIARPGPVQAWVYHENTKWAKRAVGERFGCALMIPFITTVHLSEGSGGTYCWHETSKAEKSMEILSESHSEINVQARFYLERSNPDVQRAYYFTFTETGYDLLSNLLAWGAPIREVQVYCEPATFESLKCAYERDCTTGLFSGDNLKELRDLVSSMSQGVVSSSTLLGTENWAVDIVSATGDIEADLKSYADSGDEYSGGPSSYCFYSDDIPIYVRWRR